MKKTILYVGNFFFPLGNAAGKRVYANGKMLKKLGYNVIFIGVDKGVSGTEPLKNTKRIYDEFIYYNFSYPQNNFEWIKYKKAFKELKSLLVDENIIEDLAIVIYYGEPRFSLFTTDLIRYCKHQNIKVLSDCVDWLTTKTNNLIFDMVKWVHNTYEMAYANKKADGVIAITSYLSNYYKKYGCKTVIIPPLSPVAYSLSEQGLFINDNKIITYAGLPFRKGKRVVELSILKDRIDKKIILLYEAKKIGCKFIFNIYGFTKEEYLLAIPDQKEYVNELGGSIVFHGLKSNEEVVEIVKRSDFTILIRDVNRDTTAGFPTKISESISCGTPVITTKTSDLEDYIIEGKNGFFIDIDNKEQAILDLKKILEINKEEIKIMKENCIESKLFYYQNYVYQMEEFLNEIIQSKSVELGMK